MFAVVVQLDVNTLTRFVTVHACDKFSPLLRSSECQSYNHGGARGHVGNRVSACIHARNQCAVLWRVVVLAQAFPNYLEALKKLIMHDRYRMLKRDKLLVSRGTSGPL